MEYTIETASLDTLHSDCLIVGVYLNKELSTAAQTIDQNTQGLISQLLNRGDISGKVFFFGYFALMEALQCASYLVINDCASKANQIMTALAW